MPRVKSKAYSPIQNEVTKQSAPETTQVTLIKNIFLPSGKVLKGTDLTVSWPQARQYIKSGMAVFT